MSRKSDERRSLLLLLLLLCVGLGAQLWSRDARQQDDGDSARQGRTGQVEQGCSSGGTDSPAVNSHVEGDSGGAPAAEVPDGGQGAGESGGPQAVEVPLVLLRTPAVELEAPRGRVRVLGLSAENQQGIDSEPAFSWESGPVEGGWPLRIDAQVPVGLDLRVLLLADRTSEPEGLDYSGALMKSYDPRGQLEVIYQLTGPWAGR